MKLFTIVTIALFTFLMFPSLLYAQEASNALIVSPSIMQLDLKEDKPVYILTYKNTTQNDLVIKLHAQDFRELEDGWKINFLEEKDAQNYLYSLSSWITLDKESFVLKPGEQQPVTVTIADKKLPSGGHYASIIAELESINEAGKVGLKGELSSLLFVRASTGNEIEEASVESFEQNSSWMSFPPNFTLRFKNSGNTQLTPHGLLVIKDIFGNEVARGILNENSLIALPESIRRYDISQTPHSTFLWPSRYKANLTVTYGKTEKKIQQEIMFYSLGSTNLFVVTVVLFGIGYSIVFLKRRTIKEK